MALCAWLEMAAAAKPAATTRERRIGLIFDIVITVLPFYFGVIQLLGTMTKPGKCSLTGCRNLRCNPLNRWLAVSDHHVLREEKVGTSHHVQRKYRDAMSEMTPGDDTCPLAPNSVPTAQPAGSSASAMSTNRAI